MEQKGEYDTSTQNKNGVSTDTQKSTRKGRTRKWKDLSTDPLKDGFEEYKASVIVGKTPILWNTLSPGALFSRSESGANLHVKIDAAKAVSLDTGDSLEVAPDYRKRFEVWKVTSFNSTTVVKADF
jgi:hypothetical protein